jgi:hypothetical protein
MFLARVVMVATYTLLTVKGALGVNTATESE